MSTTVKLSRNHQRPNLSARRTLTAFFLLSLLTLPCFAQTESLLIGPGDLIHIQVYDTPEMEQHVRVTDAGMAPLAFIGELKLASETPAAAAKTIETALVAKQLMLHPQVTVTVEQYASQNVSVMGQVQNPGAFPIATPQPIVKVLSLAGGLTELADRNITIERHNDPNQKLKYYFSNAADRALADGILVYPGDTVVVPKAGIVYVLGDVARPGGYPITTNDSKLTVLQAVALAGSTNKTSVANKARLIRKTGATTQEIPLQLASIEKGKASDVQLEPDDIIFVPFSWMKNVATSTASIVSQTGSAAIYLAR
jgi:polysaccharide biosynthesis/export protein